MKYLGNCKMENKHMGKHIESIRTVDLIDTSFPVDVNELFEKLLIEFPQIQDKINHEISITRVYREKHKKTRRYKETRNKWYREYYPKNKDKISEYYKKNREKRNEYYRLRYKKNKELK